MYIAHIIGYRLEGDGPLACFAFEEIQNFRCTIGNITIHGYPKCLELVQQMVDCMNPDYNLAEKQVEYNAWYGYVTERLEKSKVYFESHFIKEPAGDRPTVAENCFGHLMKMCEAMALTNPNYLRRKYIANNNNIGSLTLFVSSQLRLLIQMKRIEEQMLDPLIAQLFPYLQRAIGIN